LPETSPIYRPGVVDYDPLSTETMDQVVAAVEKKFGEGTWEKYETEKLTDKQNREVESYMDSLGEFEIWDPWAQRYKTRIRAPWREAEMVVMPKQRKIDPETGGPDADWYEFEANPIKLKKTNKRDDDMPWTWDDLKESLEPDEEYYDVLFEGIKEMWTKKQRSD
jgi:hypothetical protein